ncbi:MAG: hypothetical protein JO078_00780 [Candidatus Eremiobacteraeota bacterium]|nr:hypothetical protein [Candidatus Eremiobacteraeota bacterium]MBV9055977.1 hypothetical protein [Candidatus Eremiobacteraeota bacterium]MBV9698635.1 hypothetical protein [Candidatus Eremiobacteraeota bacterium]
MQRYLRGGVLAALGALAIGVAACSGHAGYAPLPSAPQAPAQNGPLPAATATPPVTAPVLIAYPYTNSWTTRTWAGPTATPMVTNGSDAGRITVKFRIDKKTGVYDVVERVKSRTAGSLEVLNSAIAFARHRGGIAQIILSDNFTFTAGTLTETGMDTYPNGQNSIDFPMYTGRRWSAAAAHTSYVNIQEAGSNPFAQNTSFTEAADGTYHGQTSFSSVKGRHNQDNYASTTRVVLDGPSIYRLSERAAGYNRLTQLFELPKGDFIDVRSLGREPLPFKRGTVKVPDWYPGGGPLPKTLYADDFRVAGPARMPSDCRARRGESSTKVVETFANLDPVQGFYNTYTANYYLTQLAQNQYWFACIVETYTNDTYANGWAMSGGNWGGLTSEQVGTEVLIATKVTTPSAILPQALLALPALTFPSVGFRTHVGG